jgi:hypothetical protein
MWRWNPYTQQWEQGMSEFQKAMIAILVSVLLLVVGFFLIRAYAPCALPLNNEERFLCHMQDQVEIEGDY